MLKILFNFKKRSTFAQLLVIDNVLYDLLRAYKFFRVVIAAIVELDRHLFLGLFRGQLRGVDKLVDACHIRRARGRELYNKFKIMCIVDYIIFSFEGI